MFTKDQILKMLETTSPDDLAAAFTSSLNTAIKEKEEAEKKAKKEAAERAALENDTALLVDHIKNYVAVHFPSFPVEVFKGVDIATITDACAHVFNDKNLIREINTLRKLMTIGDPTPSTKTDGAALEVKPITATTTKNNGDPLDNFLRAYGLKL